MPRITIKVGARERLEPAISKATPLGALGTEALVWIGATCISGCTTRCGRWLTPWSRRPTSPTTTTPTPTPSTSASGSTATPTTDPVPA